MKQCPSNTQRSFKSAERGLPKFRELAISAGERSYRDVPLRCKSQAALERYL